MKGVVWKSKLSGSRLTDERPAGMESYKKPLVVMFSSLLLQSGR